MKNQNYESTAIACKVVLIGESGVGKTSIIARYVKNTFSSETLPTPGASFASKSMDFTEYDKVIKFDVNFQNIYFKDLGHCRSRKVQKSCKNILSKL